MASRPLFYTGKEPLPPALRVPVASAILRCDLPESTIQDWRDAAALARACGEEEAGQLLDRIARLRTGYAERETQLDGHHDFSIEAVIRDIRDLASLPPHSPAKEAIPSWPDEVGALQNRLQPPTPLTAQGLVTLTATLDDALAGGDIESLFRVLTTVKREILVSGRLDVGSLAQMDTGLLELAAAVARNGVHDLVAANVLLGFEPFGSATFFSAAARQPEGRLGPWLRGVGRLLRSPADLFGLVRLAIGPERMSAPEGQGMLALLASHLPFTQIRQIGEICEEQGLTITLRGLILAIGQDPVRDPAPLWTLRDRAIDAGDILLGAEGQAAILRRMPNDLGEWVVLGELLGTAGEAEAAKAALEHAVALAPYDKGAVERREALAAGRFGRFHVTAGFDNAGRGRRAHIKR